MFSIVIRNKNEAYYLNRVLSILTSVYKDDIDEIIIVDNESTDNSVEIANQYDCKVVNISNFSYGRAINLGINNTKNKYVLLLSAHAIPVGKSFFKNALEFLLTNTNVGGLRFINSVENYERALVNDYLIEEPLKHGLMAACCVVVKDAWEKYKFDEDLECSEDKEWSDTIEKYGYKIYDLNETFFYFIKRSRESLMSRYKNEMLVHYQLNELNPPNTFKILGSFFKKVFITNPLNYFSYCFIDFKKAIALLQIKRTLKKRRK